MEFQSIPYPEGGTYVDPQKTPFFGLSKEEGMVHFACLLEDRSKDTSSCALVGLSAGTAM